MAWDAVVLPKEAVGAGGKWEARPAKESRDEVARVVYKIVSIEQDRLIAKITFTASELDRKTKAPAMTARGTGDITIDLGRIMPAKGNLIYRMEGSGHGEAGKKEDMKMRMELRIEAK